MRRQPNLKQLVILIALAFLKGFILDIKMINTLRDIFDLIKIYQYQNTHGILNMYGITVTAKLQNKLAKDSIVMSLKNMSEELFNESGDLLIRCFTEVSDTQIDMFHLWKDKSTLSKTRTKFSNKFWNGLKK